MKISGPYEENDTIVKAMLEYMKKYKVDGETRYLEENQDILKEAVSASVRVEVDVDRLFPATDDSPVNKASDDSSIYSIKSNGHSLQIDGQDENLQFEWLKSKVVQSARVKKHTIKSGSKIMMRLSRLDDGRTIQSSKQKGGVHRVKRKSGL